jgi:hypothetical protein
VTGTLLVSARRPLVVNAFTTSAQFTNEMKRLIFNAFATSNANAYLTSMPPTNARRPPARRLLVPIKAFLTYKLPLNARRLCVTNTVSTRRPLVANALPTHDRRRQPESSFCGFAVNASMPGLLARPRGNSNVRLLLPACNMSRNAALARCKRKSSVSRRPPHEQRPKPTRLTSSTDRPRRRLENSADRRRPRGRKRWYKQLTNNVPTRPPQHPRS